MAIHISVLNEKFDSQDWIGQSRNGFKESNLEHQCTHRYDMFVPCPLKTQLVSFGLNILKKNVV